LKEMNTLLHQGCIKLIRSDSKDVYNVTRFQFQMLLFLTTSHGTIWKKRITVFHKNNNTAVFNCFQN